MMTVKRVRGGLMRDYMRANHYTRTCHNGPYGYGPFDAGGMVGACAFATPCSELVRASVFGAQYKRHVTELHRLFIGDEQRKGAASILISRSLKLMHNDKPNIYAVLAFADSTEGHHGGVYQASSFLFTGETGTKRQFYRDQEGRLRHQRQGGHNITNKEAIERGWRKEYRGSKYKYLKITRRCPASVMASLIPTVKRYPKPNSQPKGMHREL